MGKLFTFFMFILLTSINYAQQNSITGRVLDNSNQAIPGVNVQLLDYDIGGVTNSNGEFLIEHIPKGQHIIKMTYIGFKTKEVKVSIEKTQQNDLGDIILYEGNELLSEVRIVGERRNKFARKETAYVSKMSLRDIENSQVYSTVTSQLLESQVTTNFEDALKNATGIDKLWTSTGRGGDGAGYYSLRGFSVQPQLVNGVPGLTNGTINAANIERIEVLKGPSATLFGNAVSSYGGLINVVTKKPYSSFGGELSYTTGSYGYNRLVGDINTPLSDTEDIYFRLNTAYATQESFQDAGFRDNFFVAPSLTYRVNNKLSFNFYAEITQSEQTNPVFLFLNRSAPNAASNIDELNYNNKLSFTSNDLSLKNPTQNYRAEMNYKLSDAWQSETILSKSATSTQGYYSYLFNYGILGDNIFTRLINKQNSRTNTLDLQQNFKGDFKISGIRNRVLIGLDYFHEQMTDQSTGYAFYGNITPQGDLIPDDPFTPDVETGSFPLNSAGVDAALANQSTGSSKTKSEIYSLYVSDVIDFTSYFSAMASVRLDHFRNDGDISTSDDDYDQTTLSPKFGIIFKPIADQLSIFANYQNSFSNVAPQLVGDPNEGPQSLKSFDPEQANQYEFGTKANLFDDKLNLTLSYYNIKVTDQVMTDPNSPFNKIQNGEVESKGYEIELNTNPINGLNIRAGYSHNESEVLKTDNANILGTRPLEAGPENHYHIWADYKFQANKLKNFGLGFGVNGANESFAINYKNTGEFTLPNYTIANASLYYEHDHYRISLKLNNAFNEEYYKGWTTITPQMPRQLLAQINYRF